MIFERRGPRCDCLHRTTAHPQARAARVRQAARLDREARVPLRHAGRDARSRARRARDEELRQGLRRTAAIYMESVHTLRMCAEACHFYEVTQDPKYTPIWKLEPFKQAYKREYGPFAVIYRALNLKQKVTVERLQEWQQLIYDSCTVCGRCSLDVARWASTSRRSSRRRGTACTLPASFRTNCGP